MAGRVGPRPKAMETDVGVCNLTEQPSALRRLLRSPETARQPRERVGGIGAQPCRPRACTRSWSLFDMMCTCRPMCTAAAVLIGSRQRPDGRRHNILPPQDHPLIFGPKGATYDRFLEGFPQPPCALKVPRDVADHALAPRFRVLAAGDPMSPPPLPAV